MNIEKLAEWMEDSDYTVFFGGAGISTESGIPDFRSANGLYRQEYPYPPEIMLSHRFFMSYPEEFYRYYREALMPLEAAPNRAHRALAELEKRGRLRAVITQNVDGLHQKAGSRQVLELHGSIYRNHCLDCGALYGPEAIRTGVAVPRCPCGGVIRPDVVLYEELLDDKVLERAIQEMERADMVIVGGTSLTVYPAAGLLRHYSGNRLALINKSPTAFDERCDLLLQGSAGEVLAGAVKALSRLPN